jgi:hypothetical protein
VVPVTVLVLITRIERPYKATIEAVLSCRLGHWEGSGYRTRAFFVYPANQLC